MHSETQTANNNGEFWFDNLGIDLVAGHVVTVSDGTTTKTHTVSVKISMNVFK